MDFGNFLNKLDESKGFKRVSGRQLAEAAGESVEALKSKAKWYYIPQDAYGSGTGFRHIIVEYGDNDWAIYYLDKAGVGDGGAADISGMGDLGNLKGSVRAGVSQEEARDLARLANYLKEGAGEDNGVNLVGWELMPGRFERGTFAEILKECVEVVKQGKATGK